MPKAPLESRVVFRREELLDGLTKLAPTAKKSPSSLVKLELSKSPACIKAEHDGTASFLTRIILQTHENIRPRTVIRSSVTIFWLMRRALVIGFLLIWSILGNAQQGLSVPNGASVTDCAHFLPYSPDPNHLWNRVHKQLLDRRDKSGAVWGCDEVDPLLWPQTKGVLAGHAYTKTNRLLDQFIRSHGERLVRDPLRRALFQRDLWAVFDWVAEPYAYKYQSERAELEKRLAQIIVAVALTPTEVQHLPDNYEVLLDGHDAVLARDGFELPNNNPGWMLIGRDDGTPAAPIHSFPFPRSVFLVYLHLPPGSDIAAYIDSMHSYSQRRPLGEDCFKHPCHPPQFPAGTELALIRRAILIASTGHPVVSPITESVQLRRYRKIPSKQNFDFQGMQEMAEFQFTRRGLLRGDIGLRRIDNQEAQFAVFATHGMDYFESGIEPPFPALKRCHSCHQGVGVISFTTYSRVQFANEADDDNHTTTTSRMFILLHTSREAAEETAAIAYLQSRDTWKLLRKLIGR
jgi:hypothetical protein